MKKQILSIGKALNKTEQKSIKGGFGGGGYGECTTDCDCFFLYQSNLTFGYICVSSPFGGKCERGIYLEPPCP